MSEVLPGDEILAEHNNDLNSPSWASYTPAWTSDGTQPAVGNGTIAGASRKSEDSNIVDVRFKFTRGSTSTNGTGAYFFSVPAGAAGEVGCSIGTWYMASGGQHYGGTLELQTSTTVVLVREVGVVLAGNPVTLATNDVISGRARYEPA